MKKIFYLLFVFPLFIGCSGENDASSDIAFNENIHKDSIQNTLGAQNMILNTCDDWHTFFENPPEDIEIEERYILKIEANSANELKVRDFYPEPDGISDIIQKFYTFNEKENDLKSNYPLYSTATLEMCDVEYLKLEKQIEDIDEVADKIKYDYLVSAQKIWGKKREAIQLLSRETGLTELREISKQAHIKIVVENGVKNELISSIYSVIKECILYLRNKKSIELFGESYIYYRNSINPDHKAQCYLIELSYPLIIAVFDSEGKIMRIVESL